MTLPGIATMGITITNLVQPALIHLIVRRNIKQTVLFFSLVFIVTSWIEPSFPVDLSTDGVHFYSRPIWSKNRGFHSILPSIVWDW